MGNGSSKYFMTNRVIRRFGSTIIKLEIDHVAHECSNCRMLILESWWCHQMERFSSLLALYAGNSLVTGEFPSPRPVTWSSDVFFDLCLNKWLSKQSWGRRFEMPSHSLWRHCNVTTVLPKSHQNDFIQCRMLYKYPGLIMKVFAEHVT